MKPRNPNVPLEVNSKPHRNPANWGQSTRHPAQALRPRQGRGQSGAILARGFESFQDASIGFCWTVDCGWFGELAGRSSDKPLEPECKRFQSISVNLLDSVAKNLAAVVKLRALCWHRTHFSVCERVGASDVSMCLSVCACMRAHMHACALARV